MKKLVCLVAVFALAAGCKKKKPEEGPMPTGSAQGMGSGGAMGSAMGSAGTGSAATAGMGSGTAAKAMTPEQFADRFSQCWGFFNDGKWDEFKSCYSSDAQYEMPGGPVPPATGTDAITAFAKGFKDAFPDLKGDNVLVLVNGHTIVGVTFVHGTMTGAFKTPMGEMPATKNKIGMMTSQVIEGNDKGEATHEWEFIDMATMMGQMKPDPKMPVRPAMDKAPMEKTVVVAKDDDKEKANLATVKKGVDGWNAHKAKDFGDVFADDATWSQQDMPKDFDKKTMLSNYEQFWKGFSDAKVSMDKQWAAGDYVAVVGALDAKNDGDVPFMKIKKTGKQVHVPFLWIGQLEGGKVKKAWVFEQMMAMASQLGLMPPAAPPAKGDAPKKDEAPKGSAAPAPKK